MLLQIKDGLKPKFASKNFPFLKYLSLNTAVAKDEGLVSKRQPYLANIAE